MRGAASAGWSQQGLGSVGQNTCANRQSVAKQSAMAATHLF